MATGSKKAAPKASPFLSVGYLLTAKSSDLHARMKACLAFLVSVDQAEAEKLPPGLENVVSQLLDPLLRKSKHQVRA